MRARLKFEEITSESALATGGLWRSWTVWCDCVVRLCGPTVNCVVRLCGLTVWRPTHRRPAAFSDCVVWARLKFEELFTNNIKQLLFNFPLDMYGPSSPCSPLHLGPPLP